MNQVEAKAGADHSVMDVDIAIVGGGMVGATLAALLKDSGWRIAVLDAAPIPQWSEQDNQAEYDCRVSALGAAAQQCLTKAGVWQKMQAGRLSAYQGMQVWDALGQGQIAFNAAEAGADALGTMVENRLLQASAWQVLSEAAADDGTILQLYPNTAVTDFQRLSIAGGGWQLTLANGQHDSSAEPQASGSQTLTTRLLIGADGARSRVRAAAGIQSEMRDYAQRGIVATITTELPHQGVAYQRFLANGPLALLPVQDNPQGQPQCSIVWTTSNQEANNLLALSDKAFLSALTEASDAVLGKVVSSSTRAAFPLTAHHAQEYVQPNVVLVGDAAHSIHPLAGQGVNLGLKDAQELAEVLLAARQKGRQQIELSDIRRYARHRRGDNLAMLMLTDGFQRASDSRNAASRAAEKNHGGSSSPLRLAMNAGMNIANLTKPLKQWLASQAVG